MRPWYRRVGGPLIQYNRCPESVHAQSLQSCPTLCNSMDCSPPGSSVRGILQTGILEWVAISFSRDLSDSEIRQHLLPWQADSLPLSHEKASKSHTSKNHIHRAHRCIITEPARFRVWNIIITRAKCLLCVRHCSKDFTSIN